MSFKFQTPSFKFQAPRFETQSGFTLIELLVIMSVISLLSVTMFSGQRRGVETRKLSIDAQKVVLEIRKAQNSAISARKSPECGNTFVYYGVHFDINSPAKYTLVADCDKDKVYDVGEEVETLGFNNGQISGLGVTGIPVLFLDIFFIPPATDVSINTDVTTAGRTAAIQICTSGLTDCKVISVNSKGAISTQ